MNNNININDNSCTKYPDLESYLENYVKINNKFDYNDSAGSFVCYIKIYKILNMF
jgi:hypothetical protein